MRYSPISRFKGTLLGALLGGSLAPSGKVHFENYLDLGRMAVLGIQSLIALGRLDLDDWIERQQEESAHSAATDDISIRIIIATLPVTLFFHENPIKLRQNLLRVLKIWEDDPVVRDGTLAVGYAIALALNEKLDPLTLIPQTISFIGETPTSIPKKLLRVQNLLKQGVGLSTVQAEFAKEEKLSNTIAMAFYCFLSTLEDFRLTVLQATHNDNPQVQDATLLSSQATGAITGALSGAYNGTGGIPVNWQVLLLRSNSPVWGLTSFSQMLELTDAFVGVWSGVYNLTLNPKELTEEGCEVALLSVYAAPRVIRSR
ncbi:MULTISPECIES: ADP-ribosylglycohydrolase family protein [unclassified Nostoc]|uniref:ADP-ribosylglycohydrolase family protein n=1 Tax=unclassified Nostoc TaxID=2593658 RepID=UPI0025AB43BD|nr:MULTISPECIES: ADP-ribosylglycohydrolase family protein [unclassified Nostoc]MDM9581490.1 ADP-ribosylglycohydrolase family protein [Nostoc sp. GT001]MDZ7948365.1 ADP-ribosylglycohydrolase family protein [Nostoc sp. EfeVER01]MDZ7995341.1 ADP-ribosylglycohydrolase family protein [Nostoc sp. EspVER01]